MTPLRLAILAILWGLTLAPLAGADNLLPVGDFEAGNRGDRPAEFWHRGGADYHTAYPDWKLSAENPAAGKHCVTTSSEREFVVSGECATGKVIGSVMLRSQQPASVRIRLSWWDRQKRTDVVREVSVGTAWERFQVETEVRQAGPIELAVAAKPLKVTLWADEFQVQGKSPGNQMKGATYRVDPTKLPDLQARRAGLQEYDGPGQDSDGQVNLKVDVPASPTPVPMISGGVPMPKGKLFRPARIRIVDAAAQEVPAQVEVLARWHADRSIKVLLVTVPLPIAGTALRMEFGPDVRRSASNGPPPAPAALERFELVAVDGAGQTYRGRTVSTKDERAGPLVRVTAIRGQLRTDNGARLGRYVTRYTAFRGSPVVHVAHCWINDEPAVTLPIQSAAMDVPIPLPGEAPVPTAAGVLAGRVAVRDFAENHPLGLSATATGCRIWFWPNSAKGVLLPQGFARQWEFLVDTAGSSLGQPYRTRAVPRLMPDPEWLCASGVFEFLLPPDAKQFPVFEQRVGRIPTLGRFAWSEKQAGKLFGVFNYGDAPGDGGWANLESMADHELFLHWMRTHSREHFDMARLAAEHYRDVDIHHGGGFCHTHCNNHTASGEGWSHAWIQGVRDLYFLLGDLRALEVLDEVGGCLLTKPVGWTTGRDWTRAIDNLVDIYGATGDRRFLECVKRHVAMLGQRQDPAKAICGAEKGSWYEDRYEAGCAFTWYGCQAMAKLHYDTGDPQVLEILRREIEISLDVQTKSQRSHKLLPGEKITADRQAYVLANPFALGRGSTLFPALGYLVEATGERRYLDLGVKVLAHYMLHLRGGSDASATSYATIFLHYAKRAGVGPQEEAAAYRRAREFWFEQWPTQLPNGSFEQDAFVGWDVKKIPGQDFYYDKLVRVGYYLDDKGKRSGRRSLRLHSDNRGRAISVAGSVGLKPMTRWRVSVWMKADPTMSPAASIGLRECETDVSSGLSLRPTGKRDGPWEERAAECTTVERTVATITLANSQGTGDAWFDDVAIEELGKADFLLSGNGAGRDWRPPAYGPLNLATGGNYLADPPMVGDAKVEGRPIPFTLGCLTDGVSKYDYQQKPLGSYAYWTGTAKGSLTFDLKKPSTVRRVRVNVLQDGKRKAHGTETIELFAGARQVGRIDSPQDGWNEFSGLDITTDRLKLEFTRQTRRSHLTISEVEIWGHQETADRRSR